MREERIGADAVPINWLSLDHKHSDEMVGYVEVELQLTELLFVYRNIIESLASEGVRCD